MDISPLLIHMVPLIFSYVSVISRDPIDAIRSSVGT